MPRRARLARLRRKFKRQGIAHVAKGVPYRVNNSIRFLRWAWLLRFKRVDRDVQRVRGPKGPGTGRGVLAHWPRMGLRDKMRTAGVPAGTLVSHMTEAQALAAHSPDGYRIHTLRRDVDECAKYGLIPVWEPKGSGLKDQEFWDAEVAYAHSQGVHPEAYALPAHWDVLPYMKRAGIKKTRRLKGH